MFIFRKGFAPLSRIVLAALLATGLGMAAELPEGFRLEPVVGGLDEPTALAESDDGRLLIAQKNGTIREIRHGRLMAQPFFEIPVDSSGEGGLLGLAIDPGAPVSRAVLFYATDSSGTNYVGRIDRTTGQIETVLGNLGSAPTGQRVGGGIAFGPDGNLYVATGDMESSATARDDGSLQGKILRSTPDGAIPADNPDPASYVYAKGVRFGRGVAVGDDGVYASDAGDAVDSSVDELNFVPAGGDLGWDEVTGDSGGVYDDPLVVWDPVIGARGVALFGTLGFPDAASDGEDSDHDRLGPDAYPGVRRVDDNGQGVCVGSENNGEPCTSNADCPQTRIDVSFGFITESSYCEFLDDEAEYCPGGTPFGDDACGNSGAAGVDEPDESFVGNLFMAGASGDVITRAVVDPSDATVLSASETFFDASFLPDCPTGFTGVLYGDDGFLYALATNGGAAGDGALYRIVHDDQPGPREVSRAGSYFPLMVGATGSENEVEVSWEDLRSDAYQPRDDGADPLLPEREYSVWMGDLGNFYSHAVVDGLGATPGTAVNDALRSATFDSGEGNKYFLVSARGANLEGSLGTDSSGTERPGYTVTDLCENIGLHAEPDFDLFTCGQNFTLVDEQGEEQSLYEWRGHPMMLDFSAEWCPPCRAEADVLENLHDDYKDRGVKVLTVLFDEESNGPNWVGRPTPAECQVWSDREDPNPDHTFPCWVDSLTDGPPYERQAWPLYNKFNSVPTNVVIDRGLRVVYTTGGYPESTIREKLDALVGTTDSCLH